MAELKSRRSVGGRVGDTNNGFTITKVFSDGVYLWDSQLEEKIGDIENELDEIAEEDHLQMVLDILIF